MTLIRENGVHATVSISKRILDWLADRRIFSTQQAGGTRWREGHILTFRKDLTLEPYTCFLRGNTLHRMGAYSYSRSDLGAEAKVGRYCSIADDVALPFRRHPIEAVSTSTIFYDHGGAIARAAFADAGASAAKPIPNPQKPRAVVGNDVWIGASVLIMPGVTIGNGAAIAAGSVVTKDVPDFAVVGGNPARVIRLRFPPDVCERLTALEWWRFSAADLARLPMHDPLQFIPALAGSGIQPYTPEPIAVWDEVAALL